MPTEVVIRCFAPADHLALEQLWDRVLSDEPPGNAPADLIALKQRVQPELLLVAVLGDALVGAVMGGFDGTRGWIHYLAVAPEHRRRGYASRLVRAVEEGLSRLGCPKVNLQVRSSNATVVAFYETLDYLVEDRVSMGHRLPGAALAASGLVRPARESDLPALIEIGRRSWLSAFAQTAPFPLVAWWAGSNRTATLYQEWWPEMQVLDDDGALVGLVHRRVGEINGLWVHPDHHGRGAGTRLLAAGEAAAREDGHASVWLICSAFNVRALSFYRRRGYVETGRQRYVHQSGVDAEDVRLEKTVRE